MPHLFRSRNFTGYLDPTAVLLAAAGGELNTNAGSSALRNGIMFTLLEII
jgi:hypothetical protein